MPSVPLLRHSAKLAPLARALVIALTTLGASPSAQAQPVPGAQASRHYQVPPGPLGLALSRFAAQAGVVLSFDATLTQGRQRPGLQRDYGVAAGLAGMLSATGL